MKKLTIVNILYLLVAFGNLYFGRGTNLDRGFLFVGIPPLIIEIFILVREEVKTRKKLKQMREEEKNRKESGR